MIELGFSEFSLVGQALAGRWPTGMSFRSGVRIGGWHRLKTDALRSNVLRSRIEAMERIVWMKRLLVTVGLVGACIIVPAAAQAAPRTGVVVDYRSRSHTATVALKTGRLLAIHTGKAVRVGSRVRVTRLRTLRNGTSAASLVRIGKAKHARIKGVVVARIGRGAIAIGARGTTFMVRTRHAKTRRAFSMDDVLAVGTTVVADVSINGSELEADDVTALQAPQPGQMLELEGRVSAVDPLLRTLTISVKDDGLAADFKVLVPDTTIDLTKFVVGAEVELHVTSNGDGTFTLSAGALNGDENEADDDNGDEGMYSSGDSGHHHG